MNKTSIYYFSLAAIAIGSLASCQDYEPFDEETVRETAVLKEYQKNFEARYGKIDPNHTWGFQDIVIAGGNSQGTRAAGNELHDPTEPSQTNWYSVYGVIPPGAPDSWNTNSPYEQNWAGAVTAEEILWVSEYFRTHTYAQMEKDMVKLHLTDFFVENVSSDSDQDNYTGIHGQGTVLTSRGGSDDFTYGMDQLLARTMDSSDDYSTWHHINNFNYGNTVNRPQQYADNSANPYLPKDEAGHIALDLTNPTNDDVDKDDYRTEMSLNKNRTCMYVHSSGTESFAFHPSWDDQSAYYESYVLVHLSFDVNGHHYDGNYLAFDWQGTKGSTHVDPDGYYNNWIIKVTPANYKPSPKFPVTRIMCEDLGNTLDFDFNDLVFDVKYELTTSNEVDRVDAVLVIQASGGTLPIWVGEKDDNHEAHFLLGNAKGETGTPINVSAPNGKTHDVAIIRLPLTQGTDWSKNSDGSIVVNPNNINIWVGSTTASLVTEAKLLPQSGKGNDAAPQKISIPYTDTRWLKESQQIEWGYGYFDEWVKDETKYGFYQLNEDGSYKRDWVNNEFIILRNTEAWTEKHKSPSSDPNNVGSTEESHLY